MRESRLARALTKSFHQMGAPALLVLPCYLIPIMVFVLTGFLWELIVPGVIVHLYLRYKFRKDEYWLANYMDAIKEDQYLEP